MVYRGSLSHFIALILLAVSLAEESYAGLAISPEPRDRNECLAGEASKRQIDNILKGKATVFNDGLLQKWRSLPLNAYGYRTEIPHATQVSPSCMDTKGKTLTLGEAQARELAGIMSVPNPQRFVRRDCIARAIKRIPGMVGENIACELKGANDKKRGLIMQEREVAIHGTPCVTEDYVDYVHWTVNQVINCLSDPGDPIDPDIIFNKLSRESAFAAFYRWPGGRGLAQMTGEAIKEMSPGDSGHNFLLSRMRRNEAACKQFEHIINPPKVNGVVPANSCRYISMGEGVARNLLHGIGLYLFYRNAAPGATAEKELLALGFGKNPNFIKMRDYLTLMAFNLGNGGMHKYLKRGIGEKKKRASMSFADFKKIVDKQKYLREVQGTADEVLGDPPITCSEGAW